MDELALASMRSRWRAHTAIMLLAIAAIVLVPRSALAMSATQVGTAQDPDRASERRVGHQRELRAQLRDPAQRRELWSQVRRLRVKQCEMSAAGVRGVEPASDDFQPVAAATVEDPAALARLTAALEQVLASCPLPAADAVSQVEGHMSFRAQLELGDGRAIEWWFDEANWLTLAPWPAHRIARDGALATELAALADTAARLRSREVVACRSAADLQALPASVRVLRVPVEILAACPQVLERCSGLEVLDLNGAPRPPLARYASCAPEQLVKLLQAAPGLRRLCMPAGCIDAAVAQQLAALPRLRALSLWGPVASVPTALFSPLAEHLEELRLCDGLGDAPPTATQFAAIAQMRSLRELRSRVAAAAAAAAAACLRSLPALRRLVLAGDFAESPSALLAELPRTRIERLMLTRMNLNADDLALLADVPSLLEVDLSGSCCTDDGCAAAFAKWSRVRRLDLRFCAIAPRQAGDVARALAGCSVLWTEERLSTSWYPPLAAEPSWTPD